MFDHLVPSWRYCWGCYGTFRSGALLEEVGHCGNPLRFTALPHFLFSLSASGVGIQCISQLPASASIPFHLLPRPPYHNGFYPSGTANQNNLIFTDLLLDLGIVPQESKLVPFPPPPTMAEPSEQCESEDKS